MNRMNKNYGRVLISCIYNRKTQVPVETEKQYMQEHKNRNENQGGLCELVGLNKYQVKPYFDLDPKGDFDYSIVDDICNDIKKVYDDDIYIGGREAREEKGIIKHSRRLYLRARITWTNIPILFKDVFDKYPILDRSVYDKNRVLFVPLSDRKKDLEVPVLKNIEGSIFDCCATYIKEDYEDLDLRITKVEEPKKTEEPEKFDFIANLCDETETNDSNLNFTEIITKLSKKRATEFQDWSYFGICLINLYHRKIISRGNLYDLYDLFSSKGDNYDADSVFKFLDTNISRFDGKGYGLKYLLNCLKTDDEDYYKTITKKDMMINGSNDDIGAAAIVVDYYRELLIICKGVLYVKYNDIWIYHKEHVKNVLRDMIGKLDIQFYGADGKRKYYYSRSRSHQDDCIICINSNQTIINDKFHDNMFKNNKYYLPFHDGIYSFKEKKLYQYNELPNIHFTYKIDRNFPKFNKKDNEDLMKRVIIPIYPNKEESDYNAHVKARALAGLYKDKKWYGYSGSRNSGKGTETGLLKAAFGEFVKEFNAKCLINNKFGNAEPAKALGWVVEKKDARIIISNEIDGNEDTKLNGAFIKTLASGGDTMEGRRLYEQLISFVPQFTMFLCYNKLFDIDMEDAKENLEQFEYKSKFVSKEELDKLPNVPFLKLKDEDIKEFISEERIIDAYTLYILNAFSNPRMPTPESVKISTNLNNGETKMTAETFIIHNFITTNDSKDRIHTEDIKDILNEKGYKLSVVETGRLINRIGLGKYNDKCNIDKVRKGGFDYIKYMGNEN